ncbi:MAG: Trm112 family protein [Deltaproteobacteria bacterium]|nr:Trm112 family protein [Deltaproteobacteria bacterium]MDQ3295207.1 Trm112 family protein [Myxococcota bacterium]
MPSELVEILVCPKSRQPLVYFPRGEANDDDTQGFLLCMASRLRYRIEDGVPVMLIDEAREVSDETLERLARRASELGLRVP